MTHVDRDRFGAENLASDGFSIVVPVFNEEVSIARTASLLLAGLPPKNVDLVYVCNGCTDRSASVLRELIHGRGLVLELPVANKALAIREAERHIGRFPRFYVDSDILVRGAALERMAEQLRRNDLDLLSPRIRYDFTGASGLAQAASQVWLDLPHGRRAAFHHVLCVSRRGRERWSMFPDLIADDAFVESRIPAGRKAIATDIVITARPPLTFSAFVRVRQRWIVGNRQLARSGVEAPRTPGQRRALFDLAFAQGRMFPAGVYLVGRIMASVLALATRMDRYVWHHDDTSRRPDPLSGIFESEEQDGGGST